MNKGIAIGSKGMHAGVRNPCQKKSKEMMNTGFRVRTNLGAEEQVRVARHLRVRLCGQGPVFHINNIISKLSKAYA